MAQETQAETEAAETEAGATPISETRIDYKAVIEGVPEDDIRDILEKTSQLRALRKTPPATLAGLRRRANDDVTRLRQALRSEGFYDATVRSRLDAESDPVKVTLDVSTGPVYLLADARIIYTQDVPEGAKVPRSIADLEGLSAGMRARAPRIVSAQGQILTALRNNGFPTPSVADRKAVVDHDSQTLTVTWRIDPGPYAVFGEVSVAGLESVEPDYVRQFPTWKQGAPYDQREVRATRRALMGTNLFGGLEVIRGEPQDGRIPITLRFTEREHRSIGFGARYSTAEGPSVSAFWEHRNAFGQNETTRAKVEIGEIHQELTGRLTKPRFWRPDQTFGSELSLSRQSSDAYTERALSSLAEIEREFDETWSAALGGSLEMTETKDNKGTRTFLLAGAPSRVRRDTRDNPLNPTEGSLLSLFATPYAVTVDKTEAFLRSEISGSTYLAVDDEARFIFAVRSRIGTIVGPETDSIPASKRFFAGGGGSLRGFPFQSVGPLDSSDDPLGGRSVFETNLEARWRVTENIGIVPFIDAGNVYDGSMPLTDSDVSSPLRFAAGLGLRYFTPIGPVRVDVARAIDRRDVDAPFELYISFGQAF